MLFHDITQTVSEIIVIAVSAPIIRIIYSSKRSEILFQKDNSFSIIGASEWRVLDAGDDVEVYECGMISRLITNGTSDPDTYEED